MKTFITTVIGAAAAAALTLPATTPEQGPLTLLLLLGLALVAGAQPVRLPCMRAELTATHPVILAALAACGPRDAVTVAMAGVIAATIAGRGGGRAVRVAFNLAAVALSTALAGWSFVLLGGRVGAFEPATLPPLLAAAAAFFAANTGLVAAAVALERGQGLVETWKATFAWTAASYFSALSLAAGLLFLLRETGPWGLALGVPPCWLLLSFYGAHRRRIEEQQQRIDEVEKLNATLEQRVGELHAALDHVKRLQGLLPICMHCKKIRDDADHWHRIESYIAEHSDARFTHSLCEECRDLHYPETAAVDRPATR